MLLPISSACVSSASFVLFLFSMVVLCRNVCQPIIAYMTNTNITRASAALTSSPAFNSDTQPHNHLSTSSISLSPFTSSFSFPPSLHSPIIPPPSFSFFSSSHHHFTHFRFPAIDSTHQWSLRAIPHLLTNISSPSSILVVSASSQDSPIGTIDTSTKKHRPWWHGPGNVAVSYILSAPRCHLLHLPQVFAVAVADTLIGVRDEEHKKMVKLKQQSEEGGGADRGVDFGSIAIKWVNDILIDLRKVSGVLVTAQRMDSDEDTMSDAMVVVSSVGINVSSAPPDGSFEQPTTSLRQQLSQMNPPHLYEYPTAEHVLRLLSNSISSRLHQLDSYGFASFQPFLSSHCAFRHHRVWIDFDDGRSPAMEGWLEGLGEEGELIVLTGGGRGGKPGKVEKLSSGRIMKVADSSGRLLWGKKIK
eukprot:GHVS01060480.1.p1 GENE.GHVS01060480.1~~GHVS01060480.1.p1  ORF type:complete len:417 (-),score=54.08 GHVS01060480.1:237-1487(-)